MPETKITGGIKILRYSERLNQRMRSERRFRRLALVAVVFSIGFLTAILVSILLSASQSVRHHEIVVNLNPTVSDLAKSDRQNPDNEATNASTFGKLIMHEIDEVLGQSTRVDASDLFSPIAISKLAAGSATKATNGNFERRYSVPVSSNLDLYLKHGTVGETVSRIGVEDTKANPIRLLDNSSKRYLISLSNIIRLNRTALSSMDANSDESITFIETDTGILRVVEFDDDNVILELWAGEVSAVAKKMRIRTIIGRASQRSISAEQIATANFLKERGVIRSAINAGFLSSADSTYPELAGILGAILGSLFTLLLTASVAVPIGVMAAMWLEEFAPRSWLTEIIEVSVNNLAAVPSIVFGLLGAAVLMNLFGFPRSAPVTGGLVLALMTLPTIIIASRAALRAVPIDLRAAALSLGASRMQVVTDHVLPAAAPGILTGVILGLARSLGETAPLLLIGMVIFAGEIPSGFSDEATTLPVIIYKWSTGAEQAWEPLTSAAIVVLLIIMVLINLFTSYLRQRLERQW